mgnify:CR=1 FL=1
MHISYVCIKIKLTLIETVLLVSMEVYMEEIEKKAQQTGSKKPATATDPDPSDEELEGDEMLPAAVDVILETKQASVSMLQRRLKLGYARAARIVDEMEEKGIVGPFEGSKPRQLLISKDQWQEMQFKQNMAGSVSEPVPEEFPYEGDAVAQPTDRPPF